MPMASDLTASGALEAWLRAEISDFRPPFALSKFPGGQSNPTYLLSAQDKNYVLRRKPFGALLPSAHAIEREYRLIKALRPAGFPVPQAYALCEDTEVVGSAFYVMEHIKGVSYWNGGLPNLTPVQRRSVYEALTDTLASLHRIDPEAVGLGDYGKSGNYFSRQIERWTRQYRASQTDDVEAMENLIAYLPKTAPAQTHVSIVHGDYRIDNVVFAPMAGDAAQVSAVLDWELSTLGDPLADFTYFAMNWIQPAEGKAGIGGLDLKALGIPELGDVVARYCAATGRDGLPDMEWYFAYNLFRIAAILQGVKKRALMGNASSAEALAYGSRVEAYAARGWAYADKQLTVTA